MPSPCPTCAHAGPPLAGRTTCRAKTTDALAAYLERVGELLDAEVVDDDCPGWKVRTKAAPGVVGLPW